MSNIEEKEALIYIRHIPPELKNQFKAWCVKRGKSMRDVVIEMMRERVRQDIKGTGTR